MAEEQDQSSKTEEPTHKRLQDAREKGEAPKSREVTTWFMLCAGAIFLLTLAPLMGDELLDHMQVFIERPDSFNIGDHGFQDFGGLMAMALLSLVGLPFVLFVMAALLGHLVQNGLMFSPSALQFKLERISLIKGFKRLFSLNSLVEFVKAMVKLVLVSSVAVALLWPVFEGLELITSQTVGEILAKLHGLSVRLIIGVLAVLTIIAAIDWLYQKMSFLKKMRMTRQELKDEFKQTEGDPMVKRRLAEIRQQRARQRMMAAVPTATVVVTNPTHYAVALLYNEEAGMNVPRLVAKGVDEVAQRIREVARENNVPILRNPPVARSLFDDVDIDSEISPQHYEIVAKIIGYILRLQGKLPGPPGPPPVA